MNWKTSPATRSNTFMPWPAAIVQVAVQPDHPERLIRGWFANRKDEVRRIEERSTQHSAVQMSEAAHPRLGRFPEGKIRVMSRHRRGWPRRPRGSNQLTFTLPETQTITCAPIGRTGRASQRHLDQLSPVKMMPMPAIEA
jgi:hypothetical protein